MRSDLPPSKRDFKRYEYARRRDMEAGRPRRIPAAPTQRRIKAILALGWPATVFAEPLGVPKQSVTNIFARRQIFRSTAEQIERIYREYEMRVPPSTQYTRRNKTRARQLGYLPPLAWEDIERGILADQKAPTKIPSDRLDEEEVTYVLDGNWHHQISVQEKCEVVRRWLRTGRSEAELCRLTGWRPGRYARYTPTQEEA